MSVTWNVLNEGAEAPELAGFSRLSPASAGSSATVAGFRRLPTPGPLNLSVLTRRASCWIARIHDILTASKAGWQDVRDPGYPTLPGSELLEPAGRQERLFWPKEPAFGQKSRLPGYPGSTVFPVFPVFRVFRVFREYTGCCTFGLSLLLLEPKAPKGAFSGIHGNTRNTREYREYREYRVIRPVGPLAW